LPPQRFNFLLPYPEITCISHFDAKQKIPLVKLEEVERLTQIRPTSFTLLDFLHSRSKRS
jgi:hypothetical protein